MRCLAVMCHAPAPSHHRLLPRANSCLVLFPNHTSHTTPCLLTVNIPLLHCLATMIPAPEIIHTSDFPRGVITCVSFPCSIAHLTPAALSILFLLACHPLPTRLSSLSRRTFHPFLVSTLALPTSFHGTFHDVRVKTFSTHVTTKIAPDVRETWLFPHGRASLNFIIIPMCTSDVAMPCLCDAGQGCAMPHTFSPLPPHHRLLPRANSCRALCPNPQLPPCAIAPSAPPARELLSCPVS